MFVGESLVAQFDTPQSVDTALQQLKEADVPSKNLSRVTPTSQDAKEPGAGSSMQTTGAPSTSHDSQAAPGDSVFLIPGVGQLRVAGPLVNSILAQAATATPKSGQSVLAAGLLSIGIPAESIPAYDAALRAGKSLLVAHGSCDEVTAAERIIGGTRYRAYTVHGAAVVKRPDESNTYFADTPAPHEPPHQDQSGGDAAYPAFYSSPLG